MRIVSEPEKQPTEKQHAFLCMLLARIDFKEAVALIGDDGLRVGFACVALGWVSHGSLTEEGRAVASKPYRTNKFTIVDLGRDPRPD